MNEMIKEISDYPTEKIDCLYWFKRAKEQEIILKNKIYVVEIGSKSDPSDNLETTIIARIDSEGKTNSELAMILTQYVYDLFNEQYKYSGIKDNSHWFQILDMIYECFHKEYKTPVICKNDNLIYLIYKYIKIELDRNNKYISFYNDEYFEINIYKEKLIIKEYGFNKLYNRRRHAIIAWCTEDRSGYNSLYWIG